jgi:nicotinamidase-related amidase
MTVVADTTPYAWPFDGRIEPAITALVITGADAASAAAVSLDPSVERNLAALRARLASVGVLVVMVHHDLVATGGGHAGRPSPVTPSTPMSAGDDLVVVAAGHDGFYGSRLDAVLRRGGRTHLLVAGLGFETTVHSTLRRANDRGYECLVIADACACGDPSLRAAAVSSIEMSGGIFGAVGRTSDVLATYATTIPVSPPDLTQEQP